jgi:hypothetical protein
MATRATLHNTVAKPIEAFPTATSDQAADIEGTLTADGSPGDRAHDALRMADRGLHVIFDSVCDSQPPRAAEIEYVLLPAASPAVPLHPADGPLYQCRGSPRSQL